MNYETRVMLRRIFSIVLLPILPLFIVFAYLHDDGEEGFDSVASQVWELWWE